LGISTDPAFARKAADIVALYLQPPENGVVLSVDEKPHIQALERAQGWLKLPNGKALTGFNHEYKRHGTTTLFAALEVATGLVKAGHYRRRRRLEFLHFMNRVVAEHPGREIHVILDHLIRRSRNQTGKFGRAASSAVRVILDDPPIHIHPDIPAAAGANQNEPCGFTPCRLTHDSILGALPPVNFAHKLSRVSS